MAVAGAADESLLDRGGARGVGDDRFAIGARGEQQLPQLASGRVVAHHAAARHLGFEPGQHVGHVGGAAGPALAPVGAQHDDRRFLADALGVAPGVAIEDQITQHQATRGWPRPSKTCSKSFELMRIPFVHEAGGLSRGRVLAWPGSGPG